MGETAKKNEQTINIETKRKIEVFIAFLLWKEFFILSQ